MPKLDKFLRRYTDLPALIYMLRNKQITLLDPETWDDKNDSYFLRLYREKNKFQTVLALCFSQHGETYHHWRVFANGTSGVCVSFKRDELLRAIRKIPGVHMGEVQYVKLPETKKMKPAISRLPFLKRFPFEDEDEFRVIFDSHEKLKSRDVPIPLSCIDKIILSPWLHSGLSDQVKETLRNITGCHELRIDHTTLISNDKWQAFGETAENKRKAGRKRRKSSRP